MLSIRIRDPKYLGMIGQHELRIGPFVRPWFAIWSCPAHHWHCMGRLPFMGYRA